MPNVCFQPTKTLGFEVQGVRRGDCRIAGTVTADGAPARRLVTLFVYPEMTWVACQWSNATTGEYEFRRVAARPNMSSQWAVMTVDTENQLDPEVKVGFQVEAMDTGAVLYGDVLS